MKIDCLGNCHGAPPVVGVVGGKRYEASIHHGGCSRQEGAYTHGEGLISESFFVARNLEKQNLLDQ